MAKSAHIAPTASVSHQACARRRQVVDDECQAHVLAAHEGDDGAEHGEPDEENGGKLVRPDQRTMQDAECDAREEKDHLRSDKRCGRDFHKEPDGGFDGLKPRAATGEEDTVLLPAFGRTMRRTAHVRSPVMLSSAFQASAPSFSFQVL